MPELHLPNGNARSSSIRQSKITGTHTGHLPIAAAIVQTNAATASKRKTVNM
jgi:hypothetical protein